MENKAVNLKNNIDCQKEYLERNMEQLNTVVSVVLGFRTKLRLKEVKNGNETYFDIVDDRDLKELCGIMKHAFKKVTIGTFGVWWNETGVIMQFNFSYEHINGGRNGAEFLTVGIENDFIKIG